MTRTLNPEGLSRPEAFADRAFIKRYKAALRTRSLCEFCVHRTTIWGQVRCKGNEARGGGMCKDDGRQPTFAVDDSTLEEFRNAA